MNAAEVDDLNRKIEIGLTEAKTGAWLTADDARDAAVERLKERLT